MSREFHPAINRRDLIKSSALLAAGVGAWAGASETATATGPDIAAFPRPDRG